MYSPSQRYIGVELEYSGSVSSIRLIEAFYHNQEYQFCHSFTHSLHPGWQIALAAIPFKTNKVIVSVSDSQVLQKKIRIHSKLSEREKEDYVMFEMEQLAHCSRGELSIDFKELSSSDTVEILCVAVKYQSIQSIIDIFQDTPLKVHKIVLDSELSGLDMNYSKAQSLAIAGFQLNMFNFLPWREKKRKQYKHVCFALISIVMLSVFIWFIWGEFFSEQHSIEHKVTPVMKKTQSKKQGHTLKDTPIQFFKMLGMMSENQGLTWGLILLPNGQIEHVTIGDRIGLEQVKVMRILPRRIILLKNNRSYFIE